MGRVRRARAQFFQNRRIVGILPAVERAVLLADVIAVLAQQEVEGPQACEPLHRLRGVCECPDCLRLASCRILAAIQERQHAAAGLGIGRFGQNVAGTLNLLRANNPLQLLAMKLHEGPEAQMALDQLFGIGKGILEKLLNRRRNFHAANVVGRAGQGDVNPAS